LGDSADNAQGKKPPHVSKIPTAFARLAWVEERLGGIAACGALNPETEKKR